MSEGWVGEWPRRDWELTCVSVKSPRNAASARKETDWRCVDDPLEHTAASGSRRQDESNYPHRNSVRYGSEWTRTITTGSINRAAYTGAGKRPYPQDTAAIGADEEMNPTITTGTASYMGVSGPEPSPQGLYRAAYMGAGKRRYPQDTAAQRGSMTTPGATAEEALKNRS